MSCLAAWQISRLATIDDPIDPHARDCLACRRQIGEERALRARLRTLPAPAVDPVRLRELEAEIVAIVQQRGAAPAPRRRSGWAVAIALAAAATVVLVMRGRAGPSIAPVALDAPLPVEAAAIAERAVAQDDPAPVVPPASRGTEVVALVDGTLELDTRGVRPVEVHVGGDIVRVVEAKVTIRARAHALVSVRVVVGAARVVADHRQFDLQRDTLWEPVAASVVPPATTPPPEGSLVAFEDGWLALREGRNRDAVAMFDRVDDPRAREEAMYWAAVASRRAGDVADADARVRAFVARFPDSIYVARLHR